jgi:hypothetical protein
MESVYSDGILITDINDTSFITIEKMLRSKPMLYRYPSKITNFVYPLQGVLYGCCSRIFFPITISNDHYSVNVLCLFDTGAANCYLRKQTLHALNMNTDEIAHVNIQGYDMFIHPSESACNVDIKNVDIIGQDFMKKIRGQIIINYFNDTAILQAEITALDSKNCKIS